MKPFSILQNDTSRKFVELFISMANGRADIDMDLASEFVCRMYGQSTVVSVNEARYLKLLEMSGKVDEVRIGNWRRKCRSLSSTS